MIVLTPAQVAQLGAYSASIARGGVLHVSDAGDGKIRVEYADRLSGADGVRIIDTSGTAFTEDGLIALGKPVMPRA